MTYLSEWMRPTHFTKEVSRAFDNLAGNKDFVVILEWLRNAKVDGDEKAPGIENETLYRWNQGASQVLNAILNANDTARDILNAPEPKKPVPYRNP